MAAGTGGTGIAKWIVANWCWTRVANALPPPRLGAVQAAQIRECFMYQKPQIERFGTFRELTRGGSSSGNFDSSASNWIEFFLTGPASS